MMRRRNSQSSEEDQQSQSPRRDRSRQKNNNRNIEGDESDHNQVNTQQNQQSLHSRNQDGSSSSIACQLRSIFLQFWGCVKHQKGFVFTKQQRQKMNAEEKKISKKNKYHICFEWKLQCQWDQEEQNLKIRKIFDQEQIKLPQATISLLKEIFLKTSYLFGSETTEQLYRLLMGIVKIHLDDPQHQDKRAMVHQYMEMLMKGNEFRFFNYKFSKLFKLSQDVQANLIVYKNLGEQIASVIHPYLKQQ